MTISEQKIQVGNLEWFYRESKPLGANILGTVLLLHGLPSQSYCWGEVMEDGLKWRYATKKFDVEKKLSEKDLETLLEAMRLSPSSYGIQPWKFIVVESQAMKEKLSPAAWDQTQITTL